MKKINKYSFEIVGGVKTKPDEKFSMMRTDVLQDDTISCETRGIYAKCHLDDLLEEVLVSQSARRHLIELKNKGYIDFEYDLTFRVLPEICYIQFLTNFLYDVIDKDVSILQKLPPSVSQEHQNILVMMNLATALMDRLEKEHFKHIKEN